MGSVAPRPKYSVLGSSRGLVMPALEQAIAEYFEAAPEDLRSPSGAGREFLLPPACPGAHEPARQDCGKSRRRL
jgi:hypothetical protein